MKLGATHGSGPGPAYDGDRTGTELGGLAGDRFRGRRVADEQHHHETHHKVGDLHLQIPNRNSGRKSERTMEMKIGSLAVAFYSIYRHDGVIIKQTNNRGET